MVFNIYIKIKINSFFHKTKIMTIKLSDFCLATYVTTCTCVIITHTFLALHTYMYLVLCTVIKLTLVHTPPLIFSYVKVIVPARSLVFWVTL